jgi:Tryptophan dimethylallyltransferase.
MDDHTLVELSWCWSTLPANPTFRYSVEPIGLFAGQEDDPINAAASLRLLVDNLPLAPKLHLYLHHHFENLLLSGDGPVKSNNQDSFPLQSQSIMAFELLETSIVVKQYYLPGCPDGEHCQKVKRILPLSNAQCKSFLHRFTL